jgi:hypothetical protein
VLCQILHVVPDTKLKGSLDLHQKLAAFSYRFLISYRFQILYRFWISYRFPISDSASSHRHRPRQEYLLNLEKNPKKRKKEKKRRKRKYIPNLSIGSPLCRSPKNGGAGYGAHIRVSALGVQAFLVEGILCIFMQCFMHYWLPLGR